MNIVSRLGLEVVDRFLLSEDGQDLIEYGLLAAIIATAFVLVLPALTGRLGNAFTSGQLKMNTNWVPNPPQ